MGPEMEVGESGGWEERAGRSSRATLRGDQVMAHTDKKADYSL